MHSTFCIINSDPKAGRGHPWWHQWLSSLGGAATTPFFLTRNEEAFAREKADEFRLARVYDFTRGPRMFELTPPLEGAVRLETETWRASFR